MRHRGGRRAAGARGLCLRLQVPALEALAAGFNKTRSDAKYLPFLSLSSIPREAQIQLTGTTRTDSFTWWRALPAKATVIHHVRINGRTSRSQEDYVSYWMEVSPEDLGALAQTQTIAFGLDWKYYAWMDARWRSGSIRTRSA